VGDGPEARQPRADLWPAFLALLARRTGASAATIAIERNGRRTEIWSIGQPPAPVPSDLAQLRRSRVYSQLDLPGQPPGPGFLRVLKWPMEPGEYGVAAIQRLDRDFRAIDAVKLSELLPFLPQALTSWRRIAQERVRAECDRFLAGRLATGWALFSAGGQVLDLSDSAQRLIAEAEGIRLGPEGRLQFRDIEAERRFQGAIAEAGSVSGSPSLIRISESPLLHMVVTSTMLAGSPTPLGLLRGERMARGVPVHEVARAFNLTRSEALLALLLADGFTLGDAAQELGWTIQTARSCSKQVYARLNVHSQADVVRLIHQSAIWFA